MNMMTLKEYQKDGGHISQTCLETVIGNSDQGNFDTEKLELAKIQNVIIEDLERDSVPIEKVSEEEVIKAIKKMKSQQTVMEYVPSTLNMELMKLYLSQLTL